MTKAATGRLETMPPEKLADLDLPRHVRFRIIDENNPDQSRVVHMNLGEVVFGEDMNVYRLVATSGGSHIVTSETPITVVVETAAEVSKRPAKADNDGIAQLQVIQGGVL